jgi:hypothetical protein
MDTVKIDALGIKPILPFFERIGQIKMQMMFKRKSHIYTARALPLCFHSTAPLIQVTVP